MTLHALDAVTLVPRERVCDHNRNPIYADRKIVDVDVFVACQQRGTWRQNADTGKYGLYLELLDGSGAMAFADSGPHHARLSRDHHRHQPHKPMPDRRRARRGGPPPGVKSTSAPPGAVNTCVTRFEKAKSETSKSPGRFQSWSIKAVFADCSRVCSSPNRPRKA
jgi:hypothetical protein